MAEDFRPAPMSLAQRAALRQQQPLLPPRRRRSRRVVPIVILLVLLAILIVAVGGFEVYYRDRIYPRVHIMMADLNVGGQTRDEAVSSLGPFRLEQSFRQIILTAPGGPTIYAGAHSDLHYTMDRLLTAWRAYNVGRDANQSLLNRVRAQGETLLHGTDVALAQSVNRPKLVGYLFSIAGRVNRPARPGIAGRKLDVATAARDLTGDLLNTIGKFTYQLPFITIKAQAVPHPPAHHATKSTKSKTHTTKTTTKSKTTKH